MTETIATTTKTDPEARLVLLSRFVSALDGRLIIERNWGVHVAAITLGDWLGVVVARDEETFARETVAKVRNGLQVIANTAMPSACNRWLVRLGWDVRSNLDEGWVAATRGDERVTAAIGVEVGRHWNSLLIEALDREEAIC